MSEWKPSSWRARPAEQQPTYPDPAAVRGALDRLSALPPLVSTGEITRLERYLAEAAAGRRFLLQGGDCAERFADCSAEAIASKLKIILQMSVVLTYGVRRPVVRVARIAGQYAKPRTADTEVINGVTLPAYRGDHVNGFAPDPASRRPDPDRLLDGYFHAAATLNHLRALIEGGFADLHHPETWNLDFLRASPRHAEYADIVRRIRDAIGFVEACGSDMQGTLSRVELYTSHEALLLPYEEAMTRVDRASGRAYNAGAHMLWLGDRTRGLDGAHVEYLRGIQNPIGIKVGPTCTGRDLAALVQRLNPENRPGRLTVITRLGAGRAGELLPPLVAALHDVRAEVLWSCDPMHGNGVRTTGGVKTRSFDKIVTEIVETNAAHRALGTKLGGVHLELTGEDVTECIGGASALDETGLGKNYSTGCDPRLNGEQSLEMAFLLAKL